MRQRNGRMVLSTDFARELSGMGKRF